MGLFLKLQAIQIFSHETPHIQFADNKLLEEKKPKLPIFLNKLTRKTSITSVHPKQKISLVSISKDES